MRMPEARSMRLSESSCRNEPSGDGGFIFVEIPYLSNDDAAAIQDLPDSEQNAAVKVLAYDYPLDEERRFMLEVRDEFAATACEKYPDEDPDAGTIQDPDCTCYEIGFHE